MSKLTDIKNRIDQMDGGTFQNLCDAYLSYKGYKNVYSLGMYTGTDKTAKGNPDTYFLTAENKYVFVMYTTQKKDFLNKAIEDIDKCFDSKKTGVSVEDIVEIVYCHTYGRLGPGDDQYLRQYCEEHGAVLTLIGLDQLGNDIFRECPILAKDFFGISIDSGQILPLDMFVARHDANKMSAPLGTEFLLREKEQEKAKSALHDNDVFLITGPAGVGKTRFALELCRQLAEEMGYTVLVIKNNNLQLYEDLVSAIEEGKEYLILVDDANELSGLHYVLDYLPRAAVGSRHISKLILTVRDYARKQVTQSVMEVIRPEIIKISIFKDDDILKLMETCYGITNRVYTDRIVAIAEGNARLAMLAGKLVVDSESLTAIQDASDLYHNYYGKQLKTLAESETSISSAGIIAFVQAIHLEHLEKLAPIFEALGITSSDFTSDLKLLHKAEIVDLCNDKAARISDQSFSNYLIKYVFIEEKIIPLSTMIETCFQINKSRTIEACNILLNVFSDQNVREYIEAQINLVWDKLESNVEVFLPFFKAFDCLITAQGDPFSVHDHYNIARLLKIWDTKQYMDLADNVFDYCHSKREKSMYWLYWSPVNMMLHNESSHPEIIVKQDLWIKHAIEKYGHDGEQMYQLFSAIGELSCGRRKKAVEKFLSLNADPDLFEHLPLEPFRWGGSGSTIPYMQEQTDYLRSLLPLVSGIKYLKQKQRIEREIAGWKERIRSEEVRELLES